MLTVTKFKLKLFHHLKVDGFKIKDFDIKAEDFSDFFNATTYFHSN